MWYVSGMDGSEKAARMPATLYEISVSSVCCIERRAEHKTTRFLELWLQEIAHKTEDTQLVYLHSLLIYYVSIVYVYSGGLEQSVILRMRHLVSWLTP